MTEFYQGGRRLWERQPGSLVDLTGGSCGSHDNPDLWYALDKATQTEAALVCLDCPVQPDCLHSVSKRHEHDGVWGATTANERRQARRIAWREGHRTDQDGFADRVEAILSTRVEARRWKRR